MGVTIQYFAMVLCGFSVYTLLIVSVSYLIAALQRSSSTLPENNAQWNDRSVEASALVGSEIADDSDIPVASVADDGIADDGNADQLTQEVTDIEIEDSYLSPPTTLILAYNNLDSIQYRPIGVMRAALIALVTLTISMLAIGILSSIYMILSAALQISATPQELVLLAISILTFSASSLLLRLGFQRASFGPTISAIALETIVVAGVIGLISLL